MKTAFVCPVVVVSLAVAFFAVNQGVCSPAPPVDRHHTTSTSQMSGAITVQAGVSDTGYVCSAKVINGIDRKSDTDAEKAVRQWHFSPAKKDGRPVPVVVTVEIQYERDKDGSVILKSNQPTPTKESPAQ